MHYSKKSKFTESELLALINQLNNAIEIANLGLYEWDIKNDFLQFDDTVYGFIGIGPSEFDNTMASVLNNIIHDESKEEFLDAINISSNGDDSPRQLNNEHREYRINNPIRDNCWLEFMSRVVFEDGQAVKLFGVIMDVTERVMQRKALENSKSFIEAVIENVPSPIFYKDASGHYRHFNKSFQEFIGRSRAEIMGKTVYDIANSELAEIYDQADKELIENHRKQVYESVIENTEGEIKDVVFRKVVHINDDGDVEGVIGLIQDISDIRRSEVYLERLNDAQSVLVKFSQTIMNYKDERSFFYDILSKFMTLFEDSDIGGLLEIDEHGLLSIYESKSLNVIGSQGIMPFKDSYLYRMMDGNYNRVYTASNIDISELSPDDIGIEVLENNPIKSNIFIPIIFEGNIKWLFVFSSSVVDAYNEEDVRLAEYIRSEMDLIIKSYKLFAKTVNMARYDGLTGLMNRAFFDDTIHKKIMTAGQEPFYVVLIDVDGLKRINDELGHDQGDRYLVTLSSFLSETFHDNGFWGRIGGDEFSGVISQVEADLVTRYLIDIREKYVELIEESTNGRILSGFSYGIARYPDDGTSYKQLLKNADKKMYKMKHEETMDA